MTAPRLLLRCYRELLRWKAQVCPVEVAPVDMKMI